MKLHLERRPHTMLSSNFYLILFTTLNVFYLLFTDSFLQLPNRHIGLQKLFVNHKRSQLTLRMKFEFHEAQQSHEYNVVKVQRGYYSADPDGKVDGVLDTIMSKHMDETTEVLETDQMDSTVEKYMPSLDLSDPIVSAMLRVCKVKNVSCFEMLDSRWNGNEVFKYETDIGSLFVKINRVEDVSVFMSEAVSLTSLMKTETIRVPAPLHVGVLPKVGNYGPGAFLILEYLPLQPFGSLRSDNQRKLGELLAQMHMSDALDAVHKGRFGFVANNFLSLTPQNNTWSTTWIEFFTRRMEAQLSRLYATKTYGRAALNCSDMEFRKLGDQILQALPTVLAGTTIKPSLLHGDLWIGNTGSTSAGPCVFDPSCFFGHSEYDLALSQLFGGLSPVFFEAYHAVLPRQSGFEQRSKAYTLYHYLNQLNLFGDPHVRAKCVELMHDLLGDALALQHKASDSNADG